MYYKNMNVSRQKQILFRISSANQASQLVFYSQRFSRPQASPGGIHPAVCAYLPFNGAACLGLVLLSFTLLPFSTSQHQRICGCSCEAIQKYAVGGADMWNSLFVFFFFFFFLSFPLTWFTYQRAGRQARVRIGNNRYDKQAAAYVREECMHIYIYIYLYTA